MLPPSRQFSRKTGFSIFASWVLLVYTAVVGLLETIFNSTKTAAETVTNLLFGWAGKALLGLFLVAVLSVVISDNQQVAMQEANNGYCHTAPVRYTINDGIGVIAPFLPPFICLWNLVLSWTAVLLQSLVKYVYECADWPQIWTDLKAFLATVVESVLTFFFTDLSFLGNRFDLQSIVTSFQKLLLNLQAPLDCLCFAFTDVYSFIITVLTNQNLSCALDLWFNAIILFWQSGYQTLRGLLMGQPAVPSLLFLDNICAGSICAGQWIDDFVISFLEIFIQNPPNLNLGCVLARLVCIVDDLLYIIINAWVQTIWTIGLLGQSWNPFTDTNFSPLILHINGLGMCIQNLVELVDVCLGQAAGNAIRFVADFIYYVVQIVQEANQDFSIITTSINRFIGQSTYGGGSHVANLQGHANVMNQTSLTCFISHVVQWGTTTSCGIAAGDLVNSIVDALLIPLALLDEILANQDLLANIEGNPLATDQSRADFEEFFTILLDAITSRIFGVLDYTAHLIACTTFLQSFGNTLLTVISNFRQIWSEIESLFILVVEFVFQFIVIVISIFASDIFPGQSFVDELGIFATVFVDLIIQLLDVFVAIIKIIINFTIGFFFPALFGQDTLYSDPESPATLTRCIEHFVPNCICGLTFQLFGGICIGRFTCLGDLWPPCGVFQTTPSYTTSSTSQSIRKRTIYNTTDTWENLAERYKTPFEFFAGEFKEGSCGDLFQRYKNFGSNWEDVGAYDNDVFLSETEIVRYASCVKKASDSLNYAFENDMDDIHYLMRDSQMENTSHAFAQGLGTLFVTGVANSMIYLSEPEYMLGQPTLSPPKYLSFEEQLKKNNIHDNVAVKSLKAIYNIGKSGYDVGSQYIEKMNSTNPLRNYTKLGNSFNNLLRVGWATAKIVAAEFSSSTAYDDVSTLFSDITSSISTGSWKSYMGKRTPQKRHHDGPIAQPYFPPGERSGSELFETDDFNITYADIALRKWKTAQRAFIAYGGLAFGSYFDALTRRNIAAEQFDGMEPMRFSGMQYDLQSPGDNAIPYRGGFMALGNKNKRNIWAGIKAVADPKYAGDIEFDNDFHNNVTYIYGTGGAVNFFENHIPYSCGQVSMFCDTPNATGCDSVDYFQTLGLCQSFIGNLGIVMQCNETYQAMAIYATSSCSGIPVRIAIATDIRPIDCIRLNVPPTGFQNDFFCIQYQQCTACPVTQVIPGFQCNYLDEVFHRMSWLTQRCLVQFIGPIIPPFNFSAILPNVSNPSVWSPLSTVTFTQNTNTTTTIHCPNSVCGDGILSTELDGNGQPCEQCDDRNRKNGDGCSRTCQLEFCGTLWADKFNPSGPRSIPAAVPCDTNVIYQYTRLQTKGYCLTVGKVTSPQYDPAITPTEIYSSFTFQTSATPVITSYSSTDCSGLADGEVVITSPCNETTAICTVMLTGSDADVCVQEARVGTDKGNIRCSICGDGLIENPSQCDNNPFTSPSCVYCLPVVTCNPMTQVCFGVCRQNVGYLYDYANTAPSCVASPILTSGCPTTSTCYYFFAGPLFKRDNEHIDKWDRIAKGIYHHNRLYIHNETDDTDSEPDIMHFQPRAENRKRSTIAEFQATIIPKSNWMVQWFYDKANEILANWGSSTVISPEYTQWLIDFFTNTEVDKNAPSDERGFWWYATFPFICQMPNVLDCSLGKGLSSGLVFFLYVFLGGIVVASFVFTGISSLWLSLFALLGLSFFLGIAFGYAFPGCVLVATFPFYRIPECAPTEIQKLALEFNGTCIGFLQNFATTPCTNACNQVMPDCRDLGFVDGFDSLVALIEIWAPASWAVWMRTSKEAQLWRQSLFYVDQLTGWQLATSYDIALENFNLQGAEATYDQKVCSIVTSLAVTQVGALLITAAFVTIPAVAVWIPIIIWAGLFFYALFNWIDQNVVPEHDGLEFADVEWIKQKRELERKR